MTAPCKELAFRLRLFGMQDILPTLEKWLEAGRPFALATVIKTWGSAPRPVGSALAISETNDMAGSVSGGCVEGAVARKAAEVLRSGKGELLRFGVSDEDAWSVGLSCGGNIEVWLEPFLAFDPRPEEKDVWQQLHTALNENRGCVLITAMQGPRPQHTLVWPDGSAFGAPCSDEVKQAALQAYRERRHLIHDAEGNAAFIRVFPPKSQMLIVGAAHITADLVHLGNFFGFETIVIDPRGIFAQKTTFEDPPRQLYNDWPAEVLPRFPLDAFSFAVLLTHDPKIDDQALHILLRSEVAYIGALGSRRTHAKRIDRLKKAGFTDAEIEKVHAPVGVDIKAKKPREIALSIMAEIIQVNNAYQ